MRALVALAAMAISTAASAVPITSLYNTGAGFALGSNGIDDNWRLFTETPAYVSGTNGQFPIGPWLADTNTSRWITPTNNAGDSLDPVTDDIYTYSLVFNLNGLGSNTASFAGRFAADNAVTAIRLNGNLLSANGGAFTSWKDFGTNTGFVTGFNTLEFDVTNFGQADGNPSGLRVEFLRSTAFEAVPEPQSWALMIAGFGLVGVSMRRRKSASVAA